MFHALTRSTLRSSRGMPVDQTLAGLIASALAGSALMALAAHVQVPFWPVSLSMQSAAAVLIGLVFGSHRGAAAMVAYVCEGAIGLPVFQGGAGLAYMAGPTGGYLLGFLLAAVAAGLLAERGSLNRWLSACLTILASVAIIYVPGVAWLWVLFGAEKAVRFGLYPFLLSEACKVAFLIALVCLPAFPVSRDDT